MRKLVLVSLMSLKICRFHGTNLKAFSESGYTLIEGFLLACAIVALAGKIRKSWLGICCDNAFIVSEDDLIRCLRNNVVRHCRSLSTATGSVDYEGWYAVT